MAKKQTTLSDPENTSLRKSASALQKASSMVKIPSHQPVYSNLSLITAKDPFADQELASGKSMDATNSSGIPIGIPLTLQQMIRLTEHERSQSNVPIEKLAGRRSSLISWPALRRRVTGSSKFMTIILNV